MSGGGTGIRTLETGAARLTVFKTAAFNRSAIPPWIAKDAKAIIPHNDQNLQVLIL